MYQPMIGKMPNALRSQGITAVIVSHSSIENAPNIEVDAASPIGGGVVSVCACMSSVQFNRPSDAGRDRKPSQICRLERAARCGVIVPRRNNSAQVHRPWRAIYTAARNCGLRALLSTLSSAKRRLTAVAAGLA
jgi:hypothetical protein